jgi:hypothetical protein
MQTDRIGADEEIDDNKGLTLEQIEERVETQEAHASAQILEMVCRAYCSDSSDTICRYKIFHDAFSAQFFKQIEISVNIVMVYVGVDW